MHIRCPSLCHTEVCIPEFNFAFELMLLMRFVLSFVWRKFSSVGRKNDARRWTMDKSLSLGMPRWSPQEIFKRYKHQNLGMPKASPLHQQKAPGYFSMRYIFIASCTMCYSWSVFIFCCVFIYCSIKLDPSYFVWERDTLLISYIERSCFRVNSF